MYSHRHIKIGCKGVGGFFVHGASVNVVVSANKRSKSN